MHKTSTEKAPEMKLGHPIQHVSNEFQKFRARNVFVKSIKIKMNTCHRSLSRPSVEPAHLQQQDLYRSPIVKKGKSFKTTLHNHKYPMSGTSKNDFRNTL